MAQSPNLIVVTTEQQRYDTLGVTGNEIDTTPVRMTRGPGAPLELDAKTPLPYRRNED